MRARITYNTRVEYMYSTRTRTTITQAHVRESILCTRLSCTLLRTRMWRSLRFASVRQRSERPAAAANWPIGSARAPRDVCKSTRCAGRCAVDETWARQQLHNRNRNLSYRIVSNSDRVLCAVQCANAGQSKVARCAFHFTRFYSWRACVCVGEADRPDRPPSVRCAAGSRAAEQSCRAAAQHSTDVWVRRRMRRVQSPAPSCARAIQPAHCRMRPAARTAQKRREERRELRLLRLRCVGALREASVNTMRAHKHNDTTQHTTSLTNNNTREHNTRQQSTGIVDTACALQLIHVTCCVCL